MKKTTLSLIATLVFLVSGLAQAADYSKNKDIVKAADWKKMETVTIKMDEFEYDGPLTFKKDTPYKLELKNIGEKKHYFTAPEFFKSIATRKAMVNTQAEIKADYFTAIEVLPNGQLDLYFVAPSTGSFPVYCTIDDHRKEGMDDTIVVK